MGGMFCSEVLFLYYVFSVCANRKSTHVVGQEPDLDNKLREARERQAQRLAEEARNNPAKTKKVNEKRERKKRKDKRRFAPDAPWIQGENMGGSNFRPDLRSRYKGRGGGG
uniref:Uncharacterized protein n=1 Tax=Amorphochlora amoebiformis TaxID=1561963 RepID=A0A7S0DAK3_9EUKA|mmetsp:Transcript_22807/g.35824  ORF Transcript_22807/g.35824 Transcript_22807/m.35824 type:complete len:111 (+) Transcript_22807:109-441(+)